MTRTQSDHLNKKTWMSNVLDIDTLRLTDIVWPSAHNAGMDKKAPNYEVIVGNWTTCQNDSFAWQLANGARVFDIRLGFREAADQSIFYFHHNGFQSHRVLDDLIEALVAFLDANTNEFVVLDLHQLGDGDKPFNHQKLGEILLNRLGTRLISWFDSTKTVGQLKQDSSRRRVVISAVSRPGLDGEYIWRNIPHKWSGSGITDTDQLQRLIVKTLAETPSTPLLWSLSATTYTRLGGPQHIKNHINDWFSTTGNWITRCSIINTDFFEESNLVRYCWSATSMKAVYGDRLHARP
ncbi:phosphatidylinositol-specific phospholipase C domain-containing protein [Pseudomonas sp. Ant30-3]|uniref:phosphatidylinositol-specific phospholipase C domain-containing protein n=1 Tax=Pseudomonas sp. Ant30-3 TaxID=1488328 RepID=UPI0004917606|nr:phosphatidylinositol-specific phospholipase C domain-containing protein [Pseudomonas sp. Ant30-3]